MTFLSRAPDRNRNPTKCHAGRITQPPPPPDQSDRGKKRHLPLGKSDQAIFGTQTFGSRLGAPWGSLHGAPARANPKATDVRLWNPKSRKGITQSHETETPSCVS